MKKFKEQWQITSNWQLIFPILGILSLLLSGYLLSAPILKLFHFENTIPLIILVSLILAYAFLLITLWLFKKLENKWQVTYRWELIAIFIVFAITGSTAARLSDPIMNFVHMEKATTNGFLYWFLRIVIVLPVYQIVLLIVGWLFGQFNFFWAFEKRMLSRMGFARFFKDS